VKTVGSLFPLHAPEQVAEHAKKEKDQENKKYDLGNAGRRDGNTGEAKQGGDQSHHEKCQSHS
jgi:hypothetical protein